MRTFMVLCVAAVLPLAAQHEKEGEKSKNPFLGDLKAIEAGHQLFANGCAACHGPDGGGGRGPNLRERVAWHPLDDEALFKTVQKGIPGGGMPAANLPDEQIWQVAAFVRSLTSPAIENTVPGDSRAGEELFWGKAGCSKCHGILGRGGVMGPDLGNIGATRALPQLRSAILDPDAEVAPGYHGVVAVLKNGKTLRGVARNRTNYSLQLQDTDGNLHLLSMAEVSQLTLTKGSPMPKDYGKRLSAQDLDNLVAYLSQRSVRPVEELKKQPGDTK